MIGQGGLQILSYGTATEDDYANAVDHLEMLAKIQQVVLAQPGAFGNTPLISQLQAQGVFASSFKGNGANSGIDGSSGGIAGSNNAAPWVVPPDGFEPFDFGDGGQPGVGGNPAPNGTIPLPAIGSGDVPVVQFPVPQGWDGVIFRFSNNFTGPGFVNGSGALVWKILKNGQAVKNYDHIINEMGTVQQPRETSGIRVYSGDIIQYTVANVGVIAGANQIICFLGGYFYPRRGN